MAGQAGAIEWVYLDQAREDAVRVGELVSAQAGGLPIYRVMSLDHGRAWLKDQQSGADRIGPLTDFHWKALPATW